MTTTKTSPFVRYIYWTAWPNNGAVTEHFARKYEAVRYAALNGGGGIRKFRQDSPEISSTNMDTIEIPAVGARS